MTAEDLELEQYRSLRNEILRGMEDGNQVMSFGLAAVGIVITCSVSLKETRLGFLMLAILVPALSSLVLSLWFGTQERIGRASYFVTGIESRLKVALKAPDLPLWDSWLRATSKHTRRRGHHFWNIEYSGIILFIFLIVGPLLLSFSMGDKSTGMHTKIVVVAVVGFGSILFVAWMFRRVRAWRRWLSSSFGDLE